MSTPLMPDWVISDTHFSHAKISEFAARTTPLMPSPADVDQAMIDNWRGLVKKRHVILHLGDLGFFDGKGIHEWLYDLPGRKLFVRGNHDHRLSTEWLAAHGFEEIEAPTIPYAGFQAVCTHYPQEHLASNEVNIHGHVHNNPTQLTRSHINASVELTSFAPVPFTYLADKVIKSATGRWSDYGPRDVKRKSHR